MSLVQFLRILISRKWIILGSFLACLVVATIVGMLLPKRYPAEARVILDITTPDPVTGRTYAGRDARGYVRTQTELIRDMRVAGLVVDRLGLTNSPEVIAAYRASGRSEEDGGMRAWYGRQIINNTSAGLVSGSSILAIRYVSGDPDQALAIVTALREAYVESTLQFRTDSASRTGDWYREQAEKARQELNEAEEELSKFMTEHRLVFQGGTDSEAAKLETLRSALAKARSSRVDAQTNSSVRLVNDPVVDSLRMQLATIEDELALAGTRFGPEHPSYKAIEARRNTIRTQISQAQASTRTGVAAVSGASSQSVAELEREVAAQEAIVLERKPIIDELMHLNREVEMRRDRYARASARTAELRLEADSSETGMVVLGDPTVSKTPSFPNIPLIMALAAGGGLALGIIAALFMEFIARRVRGPEDLAYAAGVPVLATVGTPPSSPLRLRIRRLISRRYRGDGDSRELQVV